MDWSFQQILDAQIAKDYEREERATPTCWRSSGLGSCLCGRYLERIGMPADEEFDARTLRVFSAGNKWEDWVMENIKKDTTIQVEQQLEFEIPEYNFKGHADARITKDGKRKVLEVKSKNSRAFWYMAKKGEGANLHHKMQLWSYLWGLGEKEGAILYVEKDTETILEYPVYYDDIELQLMVKGELDILQRAWKLQVAPEPIRDPKDWRYKYCRWHKQCLKQEHYLEENF
jgi:hypothetical protein